MGTVLLPFGASQEEAGFLPFTAFGSCHVPCFLLISIFKASNDWLNLWNTVCL